jgi:glycosyltransferase involved in cell wall biosynthesis
VDGVRATGIDPASGFVPQRGVHVFAGVNLPDSSWIEQAEAERVVVVCTAEPPSRLLDALRAMAREGERDIELVFTSAALATRFGSVGSVLPLPIELPPAIQRKPVDAAHFVAGLVGQDRPDVEEAYRHEFLSSLARRAGELAIYDPGRLRYPLGGDPAVRCVARTSGGFASFLASVDCFVHRVRPWWDEGDGRMILCAMASGIPVLCPRESLFAAEIRDGVDGLLYADEAHALQLIDDLQRLPARALALGDAARARAVERFDPVTLASQYRAALLGPLPASETSTGAARLRVA